MKIERLWQGNAVTIVGTVELDTLEARIEALEKLLVEQDAGVFGIDPRTGEPVMPWTADECYDWHMRARQAVVPSALPKDTPPR